MGDKLTAVPLYMTFKPNMSGFLFICVNIMKTNATITLYYT